MKGTHLLRWWRVLGATCIALCSLAIPTPVIAQPAHAASKPAPRTSPEEASKPSLPPGTRIWRDLAYVTNGHPRHRLDLYVPAATNPVPLILWIHGGAWRAGEKAPCPARFLLADGFAVAPVNYRLSQHATFPAQLQDVKTALRWLHAHARDHGLDPDRFGV